MITNDKVYRCACNVRGQRHSFTADTSGKHVLMIDPERSTLLQNTTWFVAPIQRGNPSKCHARATCRAPDIKKGRTLHRLASMVNNGKKRVRAINGNLLDARKANLQIVSCSDQAIMNRAVPITKLVGVHYAVPPAWLKTECHYHSSISIGGAKVHLGSFRTLEEAGCCWDAAARRLHGPNATSNQSLGFVSLRVARTKVCRTAAKQGRKKVRARQEQAAVKSLRAFNAAKMSEVQLAIPKPTASMSSF